MPIEYPLEIKKEIIQRYRDGESIRDLSQEFNIAQSTIYQWRKAYSSIQTAHITYTPREVELLSRRALKLEHELEIIRLSGHLKEVPLQERLATLEKIYEQTKQYSVHELCDALEVARGTFYNHIFRRADRTKYHEEQAMLMLKVQQIFDDSGQRFGADKIRAVLLESGVKTSKKRILAIMQELDLHSVRTNSKKQHKKLMSQKKNLLNRNFKANRPNEIWVSDITYFKVSDYGVHLCIILDLYSRKIVGYRASRNASTHLVTTTFRNAFRDRAKPKNLTFHSDRGAQYTAVTFRQLLQTCGVTQSFSATGSPHDNAVAETFFATFKREEAYRRDYTSEQDFIKSVDRYIQFYNNLRPHQTLQYKTPQSCEDEYYDFYEKQCPDNHDK